MEDLERDLIALAHAWDGAMVRNDADEIGGYMTPDWTIIGPDGSMSGRDAFLGLVRSGRLAHTEMTSAEFTVRVYGDAAVLVSRGVSGGTFDGRTFRELERSSNVFMKHEGQWKCVLTHVSRMAGAAG